MKKGKKPTEPWIEVLCHDDLIGEYRMAVPASSPALLIARVMHNIGAPLPEDLAFALVDNLLLQLQLEMQSPKKKREPEFRNLAKIPKDKFQKLGPHGERWALMRYALDTLHKSWSGDEAADWVVSELEKRGKHVSTATVLRSYNIIQEWQRQFEHDRPVTHRRKPLR